eukprot:SAG11_NODE_7207_length_1178_cov_0.846154_1_plen_46_part_00
MQTKLLVLKLDGIVGLLLKGLLVGGGPKRGDALQEVMTAAAWWQG